MYDYVITTGPEFTAFWGQQVPLGHLYVDADDADAHDCACGYKFRLHLVCIGGRHLSILRLPYSTQICLLQTVAQ